MLRAFQEAIQPDKEIFIYVYLYSDLCLCFKTWLRFIMLKLCDLFLLSCTYRYYCYMFVRSSSSLAAVNQNPSTPCRRLGNSPPGWHGGNYDSESESMWAWAYQEARWSESACHPAHLHNDGSSPCLVPAETDACDVRETKIQWGKITF